MQGAECTNGYGGASPEHASASDSEGEEASAGSGGEGAVELLAEDLELPARALASLNALRKSRQHFDVLLVAGGEETPAHKAVLAAASPYLLETLAEPLHRVAGVDAASLRALVEWAYTGRLVASAGAPARKLYEAAWRLRVEGARLALAERLVRRATPQDALELRALPDLPPQHRHHLDTFIAAHFDEICASGALAALPSVTAELLRESSAEDGGEAPRAVADAALVWLRERSLDEELYSRTHLLFVDGGGELKDCGELPAARTDAPELQEYRREAVERRRRDQGIGATTPKPLAGGELGARERAKGAGGDCAVLAARSLGPRATQALLAVHGRLVAARVAWRPAGGPVARGGKLGHTQDAPPEPDGEKRAELAGGRCAHGAAALGQRLIVCGGYDRARVLRNCEAYCPATNAWSPLADMRGARARFPAAALGGRVYVLGGSDGHNELDSVDAFEEGGETGLGKWKPRARLPGARSHAAAAADHERGILYVVGGWAGGRSLKAVHRDRERQGETGLGEWKPRARLPGARSHAAAAADHERGILYVVGGWAGGRSLKAVHRDRERQGETGLGEWKPRARLPGARSHAAAAADHERGILYVVGGWAGGRSLKAVHRDRERQGETGLGEWKPRARLPGARSHAAAAADHERGILYVVGGWAGGRSLKAVHRYDPATDSWSDGRPLTTGRSQCCAVPWRGSLWALGGCDAWRCLASTELLSLEDPEAGWTAGPLLPSARRSMGGCAWRGRLVVAGGSDGAASLRRVDWLLPGAEPAGGRWEAGPMLRRARAGLGVAELGGALYAAGGFSGREFLACVEWLPRPDAEWTMLADPPLVARTLSEPNPPSESPSPVCRALSEQHPPSGADRPEENGQNEATAHN
ncbi:influenza virus NS1A-binding protein homolog A-like [Cydia amplana]|uniref:influenza virus NS1A-binding protein homolog A-like n=1 Tax=Cydia amplana TaxID=1869771 RepID=UPI002FE56800